MNILFIARGCPEENHPTMGCFEFDQAVALKKAGHEVSFMSVDRRIILNEGVTRKRGITSFIKEGVHVYNIYILPLPIKSLYRITTLIAKILGLFLFRRVVREQGRPEVIHSHYLFNLPIATFIKRKHNIPVVSTEHWSKVHAEITPRYITFLSKSYHHADAVISVSESLQKALFSKFGVKSRIVYNMLGSDFTPKSHERSMNTRNCFNLVSVGAITKEKGVLILIDAIQECSDLPLQCFIIGEGKDEDEIKSIVSNKGITNVHLLGRKTKKEIIEVFSSSDLFVLPSYKETFGVAYIEAMSQGLPVIATRCGGPEEFIDKSNGILIETGNKQELVDAIHYMLNHLSSYDSNAIMTWCTENFSSTSISNKIIEVYKSVCR